MRMVVLMAGMLVEKRVGWKVYLMVETTVEPMA
jgi:hypothetical protein